MNKANMILTPEIADKVMEIYDEQKEVLIEDGDITYVIKVDKKFKSSKITDCAEDFRSVFFELSKKNKTESELLLIMYALIIKNFSTYTFPATLQHVIANIEKLQNLDALDKVINAFDQSEVSKVIERTSAYFKFLPLVANEVKKVVKAQRDKKKGN